MASAFSIGGHQKFTEIDVERINIVEKDGTVNLFSLLIQQEKTSAERIYFKGN